MPDTTIKVDATVRDRLAALAAEHGTTIRDLVEQLAAEVLTGEERQQRHAQAVEYIRTHLRPDFNADDEAAGEDLWATITRMQQPAAASDHTAA